MRYSIDVELADDYHYVFSKEAARKLSQVIGDDISLPERLIEFLKPHRPFEISSMMDAHCIPHESYVYFDFE